MSWQSIVNGLSEEYRSEVSYIDRSFRNVFKSKQTFINQYLEEKTDYILKRNAKFLQSDSIEQRDDFNLRYLVAKLNESAIVIGPFKSEDIDYRKLSVHFDKEEVIEWNDELRELKKDDLIGLNFIIPILESTDHLVKEITFVKKKALRYELLHKIGQKINSSINVEEVLFSILRLVKDMNFAENCSILIFQDGKRYLADKLPERYVKLENEIADKMRQDAKYFVIEDIDEYQNINYLDHIKAYEKMLCVPMLRKSHVIGTISLYGKNLPDPHFFENIADECARALSNAKEYGDVKVNAVVDGLTSMFNKKEITGKLERYVEISRERGNGVTVAIVDIDNFSHYNNTNGHVAGDKILGEFSTVLKKALRSEDIVGRFGGEEFLIIFPDMKICDAKDIALRLINSIANNKFEHGEKQPKGKLTISLGMFYCGDSSMSPEKLVESADKYLYKAKNNGRNQYQAGMLLKQGLGIMDL